MSFGGGLYLYQTLRPICNTRLLCGLPSIVLEDVADGVGLGVYLHIGLEIAAAVLPAPLIRLTHTRFTEWVILPPLLLFVLLPQPLFNFGSLDTALLLLNFLAHLLQLAVSHHILVCAVVICALEQHSFIILIILNSIFSHILLLLLFVFVIKCSLLDLLTLRIPCTTILHILVNIVFPLLLLRNYRLSLALRHPAFLHTPCCFCLFLGSLLWQQGLLGGGLWEWAGLLTLLLLLLLWVNLLCFVGLISFASDNNLIPTLFNFIWSLGIIL